MKSSEALDIVIRLQAEKLRELLKWRHYVDIFAKAVKKVFGDKAEVYVFGSAVENKLTVDSDIDILIVLDEVPKSGLERAKLVEEMWRIAEEMGIPWWYPIEAHLATQEELEILKRSGAKLVRIA